MAENMDDNIKKAKAYKDSLDAINKTLETQASRIGTLTSEMGIAFGSWQSQTKKTQEDRLKEIKLLNDATKSVQGQKAAISEAFNGALKLDGAFKKVKSSTEQFSDAMSSVRTKNIIDGIQSIEDVEKRMNDLIKSRKKGEAEQTQEFKDLKKIKEKFYTDTKDFNKENEVHFQEWVDSNGEINKILNELPFDSISEKMEFVKKLREGDLSAAEQVLATDKLTLSQKQKMLGLTESLSKSQQILSDIQAESANQMKVETNLLKNLVNVAKSNSENAFSSIVSKVKEMDQSLKDAQRDFGLSFKGASVEMAGLTSEAARFGMSTKDTVDMMGQLGDELKTTDTKYLASATGHFIAIQKATGISSEEVTTIAGEMMRAGKSAEQVEGFMDSSNKIAKKFGVNTKKVLQGVSKNIDKMRQMGFQGGEESLARMAARAERLNMDMDEMFDVAKKARNIEGAMEMASDLQLAGGSFANIDPMSLLAAARKGPEELQKILTQMGGDIGDFNKKTGELKFDAIDADRLQMVADATGQTVDSIQKGLQKAAIDNQKVDLLGLDSSVGEDAKNFLSDMTKVGKDGKTIEMSSELSDLASSAGIDIANVDDLKNLSQEDTKTLMAAREKTLEEQALANQSFSESMTALKDSVMSLFMIFEPIVNKMTEFIQFLSKSPVITGLIAAMVGLVAFGPKLAAGFKSFKDSTYSMMDGIKSVKEKGIGQSFKDMFSRSKKEEELPGTNSQDATPKGGGGLQSLAEGLKAMGDPKVFAGIGATALAAPALVLMLAGIPTLLLMAGVGALGKLVEAGFKATASGISAMGESKGILKGALAMVIVGASLIPFAFALQMMSEVGWGTVLMAITMMGVGVMALMAIGMIVAGPGGIALLLGALALVAVGVALMAFGASLMIFATAAGMMQGMEFGWLGDLGWNLLIASPGLLLGGLALMVAAPALMFGSLGLMALGVAAQALSGIDWTAFASIGDALSSIVPGLLGFSLAGLMFVNPITLLGMLLMIGNLGMLAVIMAPLSQSLNTGADGLDRFSEGLTKLQAAANSLDFERLEALKELSVGMATSGSGGGIGDQIQKIADALAALTKGGGGSGGGGNKKIEINLKLNGRQLQEIILDDTSIVS